MDSITYYQCRRGYRDKYDYVLDDVGPKFKTLEEAKKYVSCCPPIGRYHIFEITTTEKEIWTYQ